MKRFLIAAAVFAATFTNSALAADVGVSVSIGQPGFYGRLDVGDYPPPQLIYRQPRIIERTYIEREPIYLRVPPGHAKHWGRYCRDYDACGERVYFVQDGWYNREYAPRYREQYRDRRDDRRDEYRDDHREDYRDDRRGDDDHGHGHGRGHGREH
ncbi:MAG: hypothetical protein ACXW11_04855 [Methylotenera sp.]